MIITKDGELYLAICKVNNKVFMGFAPERREAMRYCIELLESR